MRRVSKFGFQLVSLFNQLRSKSCNSHIIFGHFLRDLLVVPEVLAHGNEGGKRDSLPEWTCQTNSQTACFPLKWPSQNVCGAGTPGMRRSLLCKNLGGIQGAGLIGGTNALNPKWTIHKSGQLAEPPCVIDNTPYAGRGNSSPYPDAPDSCWAFKRPGFETSKPLWGVQWRVWVFHWKPQGAWVVRTFTWVG